MWEMDNLSLRDLESKYDHVGGTEALQVVSLMNMTCVCYFVKMQNSHKHMNYPVFLFCYSYSYFVNMQNSCKHMNYPVFLNPCDLFSKEPYALVPPFSIF